MRPETLDETIREIFDAVFHAAQVRIEARGTNDDEDDDGKPIDPIHRYADALVKEAVPLAVIGLFLIGYRSVKAEIKESLES